MGMLADDIARAERSSGDGPLTQRRRRRWFWVGICIGGVVVLMGAAVVLPCAVPAKPTAQRNACVNNLRNIERAKEDWALEEQQGAGAMPEEAMIFGSDGLHGFMKHPPVCPTGGKYVVGAIGEHPTCSLAAKGHRLFGDH